MHGNGVLRLVTGTRVYLEDSLKGFDVAGLKLQ